MDGSILPPRPLSLRRAFVAGEWLRALVVIAPALAVLGALGAGQVRGAWDLATDQLAWERGRPAVIDAERSDVRELGLGLSRVTARASYYDRSELRSSRVSFYALGLDGAAARGARVDPSGRVILAASIAHAAQRWAFYAIVLGLLAGALGVVLRIAWRRLEAYRTARLVARRGEEVELEVVELVTHTVHDQPAILEVRYRAPMPDVDRAQSYREDARGEGGEVRSARFPLFARPILCAGDTRVLALAVGDRATIVREDLWPFAI